MPRPKVKPQDRRRSVKACLSCKASKIRCDSQSPCVACVRRGRGDACVYATVPSLTPSSANDSGRQLRTIETAATTTRVVTTAASGTVIEEPLSSEAQENASSPPDSWSPSSQLTQSRMIMSSKGERMYVGAISSLSFLEFLRQVLRRCMGPTSFTENALNDIMLEIDPNQLPSSLPFNAGLWEKQHLIESYFQLSSAILYPYTKDEIMGYLREFSMSTVHEIDLISRSKSRRNDLAALYLVIAIGGQTQASDPADGQGSAAYFLKAQQIAFEGMLCDPSINMIRLFVLMAFYMLGACRRNAAYMYLGVTWRTACTLGLHRKEQCKNCTKEEIDIRLRCWQSLRVLDTLVNSILGRATSAAHMRPDIDDLIDVIQYTQSTRRSALNATYQVCLMIDSIEHQLCKGTAVDFSTAEQLLERLRHWSQSLPEDLRSYSLGSPRASSNGQDREQLIGATHVACSYYFAVIMVTRPFLISHLMSKLRGRDADNSQLHPTEQQIEAAKNAKLAHACLESAIYMAQLCAKAVGSGLLHDNMSILKAWIFAAGLLLGFSLFVEEESELTRAETTNAFNSACTVLQRFSRLSPQAGHYYDILIHFNDAINKYRQQLAVEKRQFTGQYVSQIFTIADEETLEQPYQSPISRDESEALDMPSRDLAVLAQACVNAEDVTTSLWDDFSPGYQPLAMFF